MLFNTRTHTHTHTHTRPARQVIRCLLIQPFPDSALNEEAGKLLLEDYEEYDKRARLMTSIHGLSQAKRPTPLTTSGANAGGAAAGEGGKKEAGAGGEGSSPTLKKAKSEAAGKAAAGAAASATMAKVKKGLKRL